MSAPEGAKSLAQQGDINVSKDKQVEKQKSTLVFDATKDTVTTHSNQRKSKLDFKYKQTC